MAKARMRRRSGGRGGRLDWVVNEDTYGVGAIIAVAPGDLAAAPLTYPQFATQAVITTASAIRWRSAYPEGEKQFVKAVRGHIFMNVSTWAAGSIIDTTLRIVKKPFDTASGAAIAEASYDLQIAEYANERFAWQEAYYDSFTGGAPFKTVFRVKATVNQWLEPDEALFLMFQNDSSSTNTLSYRPILRTLMRAAS